MRRGQLKLVAVVGLVVVALSGFSPAKRGGSDGGDGGGCGKDSSSSSDSSGSSSSSGGTSGGTSGGSQSRPTGNITDCLGVSSTDAATVQVKAPVARSGNYTVEVSFLNDTGDVVTTGQQQVQLGSGESRSIKVRVRDSTYADQVTECRLDTIR